MDFLAFKTGWVSKFLMEKVSGVFPDESEIPFQENMAKFLWSLCLVQLSTLCLLGSALTPSSFLSAVDRQRLSKVFADSLASENANR